jgi:hypothetical protein
MILRRKKTHREAVKCQEKVAKKAVGQAQHQKRKTIWREAYFAYKGKAEHGWLE